MHVLNAALYKSAFYITDRVRYLQVRVLQDSLFPVKSMQSSPV